MAITKETTHRFTILVGDTNPEYGFEEQFNGTRNGSIEGRTSDIEPLPYPVDIMAIQSIGSGGEASVKFREVALREGGYPAIDIPGISEVSVRLNNTRGCVPTTITQVFTNNPGLGYEANSQAFRDYLIENAGSTLYGELTYTV